MIRSGLVGRSILASRSPDLHEREARAQGHELTYELVDFTARQLADSDLAATIAGLRDAGFSGFNVTFPFKQAIVPLLDELAESASLVGAVNTVAIRDGRMIGHNTDMPGFRDSLLEGLPDARLDHVVQLGAGGAGSAVAMALLSLGVRRLDLIDLDPQRGTALLGELAEHFTGRDLRLLAPAELDTRTADGIVNATPIGMKDKAGMPLSADHILPHHWLADIIYFPLETELLRVARSKGCRAINGVGMVVGQAALGFEIITGLRADKQRMRDSLD